MILTLERILWSGPLMLLLMGSHIYFSLHLRGVQCRTGEGIRKSLTGQKGENGVSPFGALATSLAAAIGTGNIIGVATAVALGGPGAVFWCWLTGVLGMATRYAETLVCLYHRRKRQDGSEAGGAMYVLEDVLHWRGMAKCFAAMGILAAVGTGAMIQSNAICQTVNDGTGIPLWLLGALVAAAAGAIILGGVQTIAAACEKLVPAMSALYLLGCGAVLIQCRTDILPALETILQSAFLPRAAGGGFVGSTIVTAMRYGTARGLFTNESGMGTAPMAAAAGPGRKPEEEALISMTGVFWDTVVICAMTGITLVAAMLHASERFQDAAAGSLCFRAFSLIPGGKLILMASLVAFAFSTVVGWCYYGECCTEYLLGKRWIFGYRMLYLACAFLGSFAPLEAIWSLGSLLAGLMAAPNVLMLLALRKEILPPVGRKRSRRERAGKDGCISAENRYNNV